MGLTEDFFIDLDRRWKQRPVERIPLRIIGSAALMLQTKYQRRTKDNDVIETDAITEPIKKTLLELAGEKTDFHKRCGAYLDIVGRAIPFLPYSPDYRAVESLKGLKNFSIEALTATDVVVSKLKRFNAVDASDVEAMVRMGAVEHTGFVDRFKSAVDGYSIDARSEELPKFIANFHAVERDYFQISVTKIDLPDWMDERWTK